MLRAAVPDIELPKWFEVTSSSSGDKTTLTLSTVIGGQARTLERTLDKDSATVMDLVGLWPDVADQVPSLARRVLDVLPVPRRCTIKGEPIPDASTATKEHARLSLSARILGKDHEWHWDSTLDKLYMADLVEMIDWLKAIQTAKDADGSPVGGATP